MGSGAFWDKSGNGHPIMGQSRKHNADLMRRQIDRFYRTAWWRRVANLLGANFIRLGRQFQTPLEWQMDQLKFADWREEAVLLASVRPKEEK